MAQLSIPQLPDGGRVPKGFFGIVTLAIVIVPMVIITLNRGLRARYDRHRIIARWTFPLWMYVSVTGVIVYFMLYQWFPHS